MHCIYMTLSAQNSHTNATMRQFNGQHEDRMLGKIDMQSICRRGSSVSVPIRSVSNTSTKKPNKRQQGNLARKVKRALSKVMSYILVYLYMESFHLHNPFPSPPKKNVEHILTLRYIFIISHSLHYFYFKIAPETLHGIL